jgi:hypothetical protein
MKKVIFIVTIVCIVLMGCSNIKTDSGLNIIFLDIDGVLNTQNAINMQISEKKGRYNEEINAFLYDFDKEAISNLKDLINDANGKIVITSNWRLNDVLMEELISQFNKNNISADIIIGETPDLHSQVTDSLRANEIKEWLNVFQDKINSFVIIDDIDEMGEYTETNLVVCDKFDGLTKKSKKKAMKVFSN